MGEGLGFMCGNRVWDFTFKSLGKGILDRGLVILGDREQ